MKVRLFNLTALAAVALASQGAAQQNEDDSLERALADLNAGLTAPAGQGVVEMGGDFRVRNRYFDGPDVVAGTDTATNARDVDTRTRLTFTFNVTENSTAFVGFNGREAWGDGVADQGATPGIYDEPVDGVQLTRGWVSVDNLAGDGGTVKIGRDYYQVGSGRIIATDHWDNRPQTYAGLWYDHGLGDFGNLHVATMPGVENGYAGAAVGDLEDESDDDVYVISLDFSFDDLEATGPIQLMPYWIRNDNPDTGVEEETWLGVDLFGDISGFGWEFEYSQHEQGDAVEGDAWYAGVDVNVEALESLPGVESGSLDISLTSADEDFAVLNPLHHDVAGFSDRLGTVGLGAGGIWTADVDTWNVGINLSPAEGWTGAFSIHNVDTGGNDMEWDEYDISVGHTFNGNVEGWFGYAIVDPSGAADDENTLWAVLDLGFGS